MPDDGCRGDGVAAVSECKGSVFPRNSNKFLPFSTDSANSVGTIGNKSGKIP